MVRGRRSLLVGALGLLAVALLSRSAGADDVAHARTIFAEGVRLFQSGDWEGARRRFREADAEHHAPAIVYNIGFAEEKLGHPQAAVDLYEAYIGEAGENGEFATSAAVAIARIKSRSTRLRLETHPPGGRLFVDGTPLEDLSPASVLVYAGHHVVVAQADGWREERLVDVRGQADTVALLLERPPTAPEAPAVDHGRAALPASVAAGPTGPDGIVWDAAFAVVPTYLFAATAALALNDKPAVSVLAGPRIQLGYAVTPRLEVMAQGIAGIGQEAKPSYMFVGGPAFGFRAASILWVGASFTGGRVETASRSVTYSTDLVFGATLEADIVAFATPYGEWLVGAQLAVLLANRINDNLPIMLPLSFGYRSY